MADTSRRLSRRGWLRRLLGRARRPPAGTDAAGQWLEGTLHAPRHLNYHLFVPAGVPATQALPLLVMLHGCNQSALEFAEGTRMNALAQLQQCAVLYPQQSKVFNPLRCWNWFDPETLAGQGEAALIVHAIEHIAASYPIDRERIYVAGLSAGGALAALLCATHPEVFAACAIHSGLMFHAASSPMDAYRAMRQGAADAELITQRIAAQRTPGSRLVPTIVIHGDRDSTVHPVNAEQIVRQLRLLAERAQPEQPASELHVERALQAGGRHYREQDYRHASQPLLRSILINGLEHAWSGGDPKHAYFDAAGPDASALMLDFMLEWRLPHLGSDCGEAV